MVLKSATFYPFWSLKFRSSRVGTFFKEMDRISYCCVSVGFDDINTNSSIHVIIQLHDVFLNISTIGVIWYQLENYRDRYRKSGT